MLLIESTNLSKRDVIGCVSTRDAARRTLAAISSAL
jgi:hypothetical protein